MKQESQHNTPRLSRLGITIALNAVIALAILFLAFETARKTAGAAHALVTSLFLTALSLPIALYSWRSIMYRTVSPAHTLAAELKTRQRQLENLMDSIADPLVVFDEQGTISMGNSAIETTMGYKKDGLNGKNISLLIPGYHAAAHHNNNTVQDAAVNKLQEVETRKKDGTSLAMEISVNEVTGNGPRCFIGIMRDISARKREQEAQRRHIRELEASNRALDDFTHIVSHDLQEPLRGIQAFAQFLAEDYAEKIDQEGKNRLRTISELAEQLSLRLYSLLHYSRLDKLGMSVQKTDLNELVRRVIELFTIQIKEKQARVTIVKKLPVILCDQVRIAEVFQNIICNALKYSDNTDNQIDIGYVTSHPRAPDENVYYIRDHGIGVDIKNLEAIFRIFHRLHKKGAYGGGTGAGLSIAEKIISQHGGKIWAESDGASKGTTFFFTIPQNGRHKK